MDVIYLPLTQYRENGNEEILLIKINLECLVCLVSMEAVESRMFKRTCYSPCYSMQMSHLFSACIRVQSETEEQQI